MNALKMLRDFRDELSGQAIFAGANIRGGGLWSRSLHIESAFPLRCEESRLRTALAALGLPPLQFSSRVPFYSERTAPIKNIIAVASGKGGVGKSTVAVNLALALQKQGAQVGILDADLYGPSVAMMLGGAQKPRAGKKIQPLRRHGLASLSMADLLNGEEEAVIWRGPLITQALLQMLRDSDWGELDYLILDLPPTTGDIPLSLAQQTVLAGALLVTTPQDVALSDVRKLKTMLDKVGIPILGVVENMAHFCCPHCQGESALFGRGGGQRLADDYALPLLASLPLLPRIHADGDAGLPTLLAAPNEAISRQYEILAWRVMVAIAARGSASAPQIEWE